MVSVEHHYPKQGRVILHIDMNAFYCSVHEAVEPEIYKGKPIAVAGSVELRRGIIVTSSYAARNMGIKTGMQVRQAMKICPDLILIKPDFDLYRNFSRRFMQIVYGYSPMVESMSIDECFVDITGSKQFGTPLEIANSIQIKIMQELSLPCSIGVAPNKLLAKMGSDMKKPNGITVLRLRDVPVVFGDKPCHYLYGIGKKTAEKLTRLGIHTLGQLAVGDDALLTKHFGILGVQLKRSANGIDPSPVNPEQEQSKSIGHTTTLPRDYTDRIEIHRVLLNLADQVARRLRKQELMASTIQITIRDPEMRTITRSLTLGAPTEHMDDIYRTSCQLYDHQWEGGNPVRLLGITLQNLTSKEDTYVQLDLFDYEKQPKRENLNRVMDGLRDKFGEGAILTAGMMSDDPSSLIRNHKARGTSLQMDHLRNNPLHKEEGE
ncbi:DNA polymerase IV [Paenibacillus pectinilyticus]|uniref:DNA polymerase IV n=1 Tax=Paenibacillus pectinilyticus TaxID=512399 RepID=UPI000A9B948B|nr:DNA polymerase IV [Paenibacillus pectinilyticus]